MAVRNYKGFVWEEDALPFSHTLTCDQASLIFFFFLRKKINEGPLIAG